MNPIEENVQIYQLNQDNKIYILSTGLIGKNLKLTCYEHHQGNNAQAIRYSSLFTIEQLRGADPIFQMTQDCEDVQWIFEDVILAQSVGILEGDGILDVYFYMSANGRRAKVILRLNGQKRPQPPQVKKYQNDEERLSRLQDDAKQLLNEQNALRRQLNSFLEENTLNNNQVNHTRSRSTNQNNYHSQLNEYNITNNISRMYNQDNNMPNLQRVQVEDDDDNEVYEVPVNDVAP
jgi:hypothetical protein